MIYQLVVALLLLPWSVHGIPMEEFLPYNGSRLCLIDAVSGIIHTSNVLDSNGVSIDKLDRTKCDEFRLSPNDDAGSYNISIGISFPFFTRQFKNVYVNTNGVISFNAPYPTFNPAPFPMPNRYLIAPFMSDVDTRGIGEIYLKETTDPSLLQAASNIVRRATYQVMGLPHFNPQWLLIATWYNVGHYDSGTNKTNTFQALLVTDGNHSFVIFNYLDDGINWNKGDYGTMPAQVGVNFGGEPSINFSLPGSRTEQVSDIELHSNINREGQFVYRVDRVIEDICNDMSGIRIITPKTPTILNGGTMQLIGPCFSGSVEGTTCVFTDKDGDVTSFVDGNGLKSFKQINGTTVNQKAICPMPLFRRLGHHNVTVTLINGKVYSAAFEVVSSMDKKADVQIDDQIGITLLNHGTRYSAKWNTEEINKDEFDEGGNITYRFESHMFTENGRWIDNTILDKQFKILVQNYRNGNVVFNQTITQPSPYKFNIYVVAIVKQTANLEIMYTSSILTYMPKINGKMSSNSNCDLWRNKTAQILNSDDLNNCPCHLNSVQSNSVLELTCGLAGDNCVDGNQCYIMGIEKEQCCYYSDGWCTVTEKPTSKKLGLRCCYDSDGNYSPQQARSYYTHPYDDDLYLQYLSSDYLPQKVCCVDSDEEMCRQYHERRPGDNGQHCLMDFTDLFTDDAVCTVNTTTGLIYTNTSTRGGKFELLDGENCTVYKLTPNNDASTGEITLSVPFCVGEQEYTKLYVNTNGLVSFNKSFTQTRPDNNSPLDNDVIITPYWTDLDITDGGNVFFKETTQAELLEYTTTQVRSVEPNMTQFEAHWAFVVDLDEC